MRILRYSLGVAACVSLLSGCGIGHDKLVMTTQSNVGVNAESTPLPTAEISISRTEAVIAPTYANGDTPPVLAGFSTKTKSILELFAPSIGSAFAVGDASLVLADLAGKPTPDSDYFKSDEIKHLHNSAVVTPIAEAELNKDWWKDMGRVRPVFFSTDTSTGVKVSWTGTGGQYPDRLNVGYKRKEWAVAPLTRRALRHRDGTIVTNPDKSQVHEIKAPSLIATIAVDVHASSSDETFSQVQFFATGKAATLLARQQEVRRSVFERVDPEGVAEMFSGQTPESRVIKDWLSKDNSNKDELQKWLNDQSPAIDNQTLLTGGGDSIDELRRLSIVHFNMVPKPTFTGVVAQLRTELVRSDLTDEQKQARRDVIQERLDALEGSRDWRTIRDAGDPTPAEKEKLQEALVEIRQLRDTPEED